MPLSTLEVRWLFEGALDPTGLEAWFRSRSPLGKEGTAGALQWLPQPLAWRADRYLLIPGAEDMGIKWREGQLQIKGRIEALSDQHLADGIVGHIERWVKWSYAEALAGPQLHSWANGSSGTVLVEKRRLQRVIRLDPSGAEFEVPAVGPCEPAVSIELTRIRCRNDANALDHNSGAGDTHWSLGVEAAPSDATTLEQFTSVLARFLEGCPALPLTGARSLSYPAWLAQIAQRGVDAGSR